MQETDRIPVTHSLGIDLTAVEIVPLFIDEDSDTARGTRPEADREPLRERLEIVRPQRRVKVVAA